MIFELARPVSGSADLDRIRNLSRRVVDPTAYIKPVTQALRNSNAPDLAYPHTLNATQAWALYEISRAQGLLGPIGVGHGKTGLDLLTPLVIPQCRTAVLLLPAALRDSIAIDYQRWARNFKLPNLFGYGGYSSSLPTLYPISYDQLSRESSARLLETLKPDLIIADEAHLLRHRTSTRTKRVLRYFADNPRTRFCGWSGTLTSKSIKDYAHLSALALKNGSPLPLHTGTVEEWAGALDANPRGIPVPSGALDSLCRVGEPTRSGFRRRLVETLGVVATEEASVDCSIYFLERKVGVPNVVNSALDALRETACRPDGEEFVEASQVYRCGRELASGFYYRWVFPRGEKKQEIDRWLEVRKEWHRELRSELKKNRPLMDSPLLCCRAAVRYREGYKGDLPVWESEWYERWLEVKHTVRPETEAVWLSDYLVEDCLQSEGIIWYEHTTFGQRLRSAGCRVFGPDAPGVEVENCEGRYAASILSHGTGRNLQYNQSSNLIGNYPSNLAAWEQLIGRTHRQGQPADEVIVQVYRHTPELKEAFRRAREYARYQQETLGSPMKLLQASYTFDPEEP